MTRSGAQLDPPEIRMPFGAEAAGWAMGAEFWEPGLP
jgi:hypothetical protein